MSNTVGKGVLETKPPGFHALKLMQKMQVRILIAYVLLNTCSMPNSIYIMRNKVTPLNPSFSLPRGEALPKVAVYHSHVSFIL